MNTENLLKSAIAHAEKRGDTKAAGQLGNLLGTYMGLRCLSTTLYHVATQPKNDADTLMAECLASEAKQRAEILYRGREQEADDAHARANALRHIRAGIAGYRDGVPEHRATAFVAGLQEARINALETALRAVCASAGRCVQHWTSGTPVHPHGLCATELQSAVESAAKLLA